MGFFDKIFGHKKAQTNTEKIPAASEQAASRNENVIKLLDLKNYIDSLMVCWMVLPDQWNFHIGSTEYYRSIY